MAITSIPQQNESAGQLGKSKADGTKPYTDPDVQIKASFWNQAVLRLIEVFTEVGLTDGSTAGSLNARMATVETWINGFLAYLESVLFTAMDAALVTLKVGRLHRTGAGAYALIKDNYSPGAAPTVTDDGNAGYSIGSLWVNSGSVGAFVCTDPKPGDARWAKIPDSANPTITGLDTTIGATNDVTISAGDDVLISSTDDTTIAAGDALALSGHTVGVTASTGDATVTAAGAINLAPTTNTNAGNKKIVSLADPTAAQDASTKIWTDQPPARSSSSTTPSAISASDIGGLIILSNAGSITLPTVNLSSSLRSGGSIWVTVVLTGGGTLTISDGSGCTHSGTPSGTSCLLVTVDGVTWLVR